MSRRCVGDAGAPRDLTQAEARGTAFSHQLGGGGAKSGGQVEGTGRHGNTETVEESVDNVKQGSVT